MNTPSNNTSQQVGKFCWEGAVKNCIHIKKKTRILKIYKHSSYLHIDINFFIKYEMGSGASVPDVLNEAKAKELAEINGIKKHLMQKRCRWKYYQGTI